MSQVMKVGLRYMAVGAGLMLLLYTVGLLLGLAPTTRLDFKLNTVELATFFIMPTFIVLAIVDFKRYRNNSILHFWQGMSIAFFVWAGLAVVSVIFVASYFLSQEQAMDDYRLNGLEMIEERKDTYIETLGIEEYEQARRSFSKATVGDILLDDVLKKMMFGVVVASITSVVFRKKEANG